MSTEKEKSLFLELARLAMDIGCGEYQVAVEYHGNVNGVQTRIVKAGVPGWVYYTDMCYLSAPGSVWTEEDAIDDLCKMIAEVKKYHPNYDADGVEL